MFNFHEHFTNAAHDLKEARLIAQEMVEHYGMGEGGRHDALAVEKILEEARLDVEGFIGRSERGILKLAEKILEREEIAREDVKEVMDDLF